MTQMKARDISIDCLRGLAVLGVVIIHSAFDGREFYFNQFLGVFFKFCVPLFIFISGYFVYQEREKINNGFGKYLKKRIVKIGLPYFLMTLLITIVARRGIKTFILELLTGTASVPYYFIIVIFQMYFLSKSILCLYEKHRNALFLFAVTCALFYSLLFYLQLYIAGKTFIPYFMWQAPNYFIWFVLGVEFSAKGRLFRQIDAIKKGNYLLIFLISLSLCLFEINFYIKNNLQEGNYIALTSMIWEFASIIFLWKFKDYFNNKLFYILGGEL